MFAFSPAGARPLASDSGGGAAAANEPTVLPRYVMKTELSMDLQRNEPSAQQQQPARGYVMRTELSMGLQGNAADDAATSTDSISSAAFEAPAPTERVRAGTFYDRCMHGSNLYRNAVVGRAAQCL